MPVRLRYTRNVSQRLDVLLAHSPEEHAGEPDLSTFAGPHANDDLVEAFPATLLHVDVATERRRDGGRQIAAGKLLGALVDG